MSVITKTQRGTGDSPGSLSRNYIPLLDQIHGHLLPRTYAEIGVFTGESLALSLPGTRAVGIDPDPRISHRVPRSAKIFRLPSDEFFQKYGATDVFGTASLDMAFIDGMHLFEFALRDFINLERWCTKDSVILVHDCYPIDEPSAARVRTTSAWTGDIWKLVLCLKEFRPDLNVSTVNVSPSGLGVITGLDPASSVLNSAYAEICDRFADLDYSVIAERTDEQLNAVVDEWTAVSRLLPPKFRSGNAKLLRLLRSLRPPERTALSRTIKRSLPAPVRRLGRLSRR